MPTTLETLQSLASSFGILHNVTGPVSPGIPINFKLTPSVIDLKVTDIVPADINLTWITKNVRFNNPTTESVFDTDPFVLSSVDALINGGMPARVPVVSTTISGFQDLQGVPGELAQLRGELPVATESPVTVSVRWSVLDENGDPIATGFTANPPTLNATEISLIFSAAIVELTNAMTIPLVNRKVRATVTLSVGAVSHSFDLPDISLTIPAIPVPSILAFFLHKNFAALNGDDDGAVFIVVPQDSPIQSFNQLQDILNTLESTVSSLTSIAEFAAFLLGITELTGALAAQPHIQFRKADSGNNFNNFNDVTLIHKFLGWLFGWTNIEAEDELSSLIFIGPPNKQVQCFNARNRRTGEGEFDLTIGPKMHVIVRDLHSANPTAEPDGNELSVVVSTSSFGDELSSLHFV